MTVFVLDAGALIAIDRNERGVMATRPEVANRLSDVARLNPLAAGPSEPGRFPCENDPRAVPSPL